MLIFAPAMWLNEIAQSDLIRTKWGKIMQEEDPAEAADKEMDRLIAQGASNTLALAFATVAPLVAERLAIAAFKKRMPMFQEPEVLSYQEALRLAMIEYPLLTMEEQQKLLDLLQTDETMQLLKK